MKLLTAFWILSLHLAACNAATITLSAIGTSTAATATLPPLATLKNPNFDTIEPIGTGKDGATTYRERQIFSIYYEIDESRTVLSDNGATRTTFIEVTQTHTNAPITRDATIVADSSHFSYHADGQNPINPTADIGEDLNCKFDGKGGGTCVELFWDSGQTLTTTFTGTLIPAATVVTQDVEQKNGSSLTSRRSSVMQAAVASLVVAIGVLYA